VAHYQGIRAHLPDTQWLNAMKRNKPKNFLIGNVLDSLDKRAKGTILRSMAIFTAIELCGSILTG
jgi:hypothetical protein